VQSFQSDVNESSKGDFGAAGVQGAYDANAGNGDGSNDQAQGETFHVETSEGYGPVGLKEDG
jgi:hypothetical protein